MQKSALTKIWRVDGPSPAAERCQRNSHFQKVVVVVFRCRPPKHTVLHSCHRLTRHPPTFSCTQPVRSDRIAWTKKGEGMLVHRVTDSTVVLTCCKGDCQNQWKTPILGLHSPETRWLYRPHDPLCRICYLHVHPINIYPYIYCPKSKDFSTHVV